MSKVAPFQPWARSLFELRQRNLLKDDPVFLACMPPGAVRQFQQPYGVQFMEDKTFGRIFVLEGGGNHIWHFIYTDGRPQTGELTGNDDNPLYYGNARGTWDGDTFVVDSKTFIDKFWFSQQRVAPYRPAAPRRALHAQRLQHPEVRGHDQRPGRLYEAMDGHLEPPVGPR